MSDKEKPGVTRRLKRGRSAQDSKGKTDSGCFVDEELEKNGSSDSSQGSISLSPVKETDSKKAKAVDKDRERDSDHTPVPSPEPNIVSVNASESALCSKENVMNEGAVINYKNENFAEKTRKASDFYCLYYSGSPEGTLKIKDVGKVKSKPPVPPKPKTRRGSAPPSSLNNLERFCQQNEEVNKRFSYSECTNKSSKPFLENSGKCDKRRSVGEQVLFFEAFARDGLMKSSGLMNSSEGIDTDSSEGASWSKSGLHNFHGDGNGLDRNRPLADTEDISFESRSNNFEAFNVSHETNQPVAPLVEEEEFAVNGSNLFQSSSNDTVNGNFHVSSTERQCLDAKNTHEMESADHLSVNGYQNGVTISLLKRDECYSDQLVDQGTRLYVSAYESDVQENQKGSGSSDHSVPEDDGLQHAPSKVNASSGIMKQPVEDSYNMMTYLESTQESLVNPQVNEIKQELSIGLRHGHGSGKQRCPGSIVGISRSNFEKDSTYELKRRSWSFSEPQPTDINSYFAQKGDQVSYTKLNSSSCESENDHLFPPVHSYHPDRTVPRRSSFHAQERRGWGSLCRPRPGSFDHSGYTSDDSSVSEPLFQPLRCRPYINKGNIFKSVSDDSSISAVGNGTPSIDKIQQRRFRHSTESRDPLRALRRQSTEFGGDKGHFEPVSDVQTPCLQTLRCTSSNATCSSSSDSEVERIFTHSEATAPIHAHLMRPTIHSGLVTATSKRKVSAMEALFGPQSLRHSCSTAQPSSNSEQLLSTRKGLSERISDFSPRPLEDDLFSEDLAEEQATDFFEIEPKETNEEPGLEFDDTDYSEFYTRCEDKDSLISAEALSIKKLLQSPQTVLPDPDIESAVLTVTERLVTSPQSEEKNSWESHNASCGNSTTEAKNHKGKQCCQSCLQNRGTQTPPAEIFRALSPPPSVGTQTPPLSLSQELLPPSLLKELQRDLQAPPPMTIQTMSPLPLQERDFSSEEHLRVVSPTSAPFSDADTLSALQSNNKAVSVEELLQILANMRVGPPDDTPKKRPVSVQKYENSLARNEYSSRSSTNSLPSNWNKLNDHASLQDDSSGDVKQLRGVPPRSSKSYDCLRQVIANKHKKSGKNQAQATAERRGSKEDIRQQLLEWRLRSELFEEEVECMEDKRKLAKDSEKKVVKISFDGSESTANIETESKLTRTHSLKRPRKDRAFSQRERSEVEVSNSDEKQEQLSCPTVKPDSEKSQEDGKVRDSFMSSAEEDSTFEEFSDSLNPGKPQSAVNEPDVHEVASPESIDIFIDYRKKNGLHITSTPKPPPYPDKSLVCRDAMVGKTDCCKIAPGKLNAEKTVSGIVTEESPSDLESQGDASSSSYSSDDDRFGEFGGSTDTVVFVDTEPNSGISLVPDLDSLDMKLVGSSSLLPVDNTENEKDEDRLDVLLGEVRRSLNLEFVDSDILDKAIEKFKQRVSPSSQTKALSSGLGMEAYVALHQADELQGIIGEIKGELKLLHDENDMLREQVVSLANQQTNGETTENSSTESSERLENLCKLYKQKKVAVDTDDEEELVEVDVCLRGFSIVPLGHLPAKKKDIHLGTVTVKGADWNGVMEAARKAFVEHIKKIDPDNYLCLGVHSIQGVETGVIVWSPDSLRRKSPRVELSQKSNPCIIQVKDGSHFSCDSLVYDTLLPKETIEKYVEELLEHRYIVLCGEQGLGKSYLAAKLAEHVVQRIGWKCSPAVSTFNVSQATRKGLKQNLATLMQSNESSSQDNRPAVIVLDQLNCLASLADVLDFSLLEKNSNCPYIIGVRDKSRKGPFSSKELSLCHYFRWLRVSVKDRQYSGLLGRFLRRKLSWARLQNELEGDDLLQLFNWLTKVWYHLNGILEEYCEPDTVIGPSVFFSCPMDFRAAEGWFATVWNNNVIPYLHQALRSGRKIFDRCISWEDPTKWVVLRYPWNKDHSRVLHTLRKLRQVDVVLNRNYLGSDNVCFAECIEENEKILRAHSTVTKRIRTVAQQNVSKRGSKGKRKTAEQMDFLGHEEDRDSVDSQSDSYLETSI